MGLPLIGVDPQCSPLQPIHHHVLQLQLPAAGIADFQVVFEPAAQGGIQVRLVEQGNLVAHIRLDALVEIRLVIAGGHGYFL
ncbi:MAG: hypothetical protein ABIF77_01645 [bacterium]